jgi:hypothetical protein
MRTQSLLSTAWGKTCGKFVFLNQALKVQNKKHTEFAIDLGGQSVIVLGHISESV